MRLWRHRALTAAMGAASACSGGDGRALPFEEPGFVPEPQRVASCLNDPSLVPPARVFKPAAGIMGHGFDAVRVGTCGGMLIDRAGECDDPRACDGAWASDCPHPVRRVLLSWGDDTWTADNGTDLALLLGGIHTPAAARTAAWMDASVDCTATEPSLVDDEWVLSSPTGSVLCDGSQTYRSVLVTHDGEVSLGDEILQPGSGGCPGRFPMLAQPVALKIGGGVGTLFAQCATLEAGSVDAFEELGGQLAALGAPRELIDACQRAASDEVRHARVMGALAASHGARVETPAVEQAGQSSAFELALSNASEGCVRETYSAVVAAYQAQHAEDPKVRAAFRRIADDELRHAALSHQLDAWLAAKLTPSQRTATASARRRTFVELRRTAMQSPSDEVARIAGWPQPTQALALADSLRAGLLA